MKQLLRKALIIGGTIASLAGFSQTTALTVDGNGNTTIPYGKSYWIGSSTDAGNRLRMHHNNSEAYIDYYPSLNFRNGLSTTLTLNSSRAKFDLKGDSYFEGSMTWGNWTSVHLDWSSQWRTPILYGDGDGSLIIGKAGKRVYVDAVQVTATWITETSDERAKENITNLESSLDKLKKLRAVRYDIKKEYAAEDVPVQNTKGISNTKKRTSLRNNNIGFLAQELEKVYPELVTKSDSTGLYGVNYIGLIPVLINAINEQQTQITSLQTTAQSNTKLEKRIAQLESQLDKCCNNGGGKLKSATESDASVTTTSLQTTSITQAILEQNNPNPFGEKTVINMSIPEGVIKAQLTVYDLTGKQLKAYTITSRNQTAYTISGTELAPGMYKYALLTDGVLVDTKTMVVTE